MSNMHKGLFALCLASVITGLICSVFWSQHSLPSHERATTQDWPDDQLSGPVFASAYQHKGRTNDGLDRIVHYVLRCGAPPSRYMPDIQKLSGPSSNTLLLTITMWYSSESTNTIEGALTAISEGSHDKDIKTLCDLLTNIQMPILVRWNPEMETPSPLYPWQNRPPVAYVKAFRHVAKVFRELAPGIRIVWGPTGFPGDLEYWPGSDVVDTVSVTLGSPSEASSTYLYPQGTTMTDILRSKLHRLRFIDKPVLILGSPTVGKDAFNPDSLDTAVLTLRQHYENTARDSLALAVDATETTDRRLLADEREPGTRPMVGVFDPQLRLVSEKDVRMEHLFADYSMITNGRLKDAIDRVASRGHDIILTAEPWTTSVDTQLLVNTSSGRYDSTIRELRNILVSTQRDVYLRWAHEMEIPVTRYPWQSQPPTTYIEAFRHFAHVVRSQTTNIFVVWGPAGDRAALDFWPGADAVDAISLAVYGLPDKDITDHARQNSFRYVLTGKLRRLGFLRKPVLLTEIGVKGPEEYQRRWLEKAARTVNEHPQILIACYFNMPDTPKVWGKIEAPDWSIGKSTFDTFMGAFLGVRQTSVFRQEQCSEYK